MKKLGTLALVAVLLCTTLAAIVCASSPARIVGDVDQNGALNSMDIRVMLRYMVGGMSFSAAQRQLADCDQNGRIDTNDARYVLRVVLEGLPPSTLPTTTTTVVTTTTTNPSLDDDGYYDNVVKP